MKPNLEFVEDIFLALKMKLVDQILIIKKLILLLFPEIYIKIQDLFNIIMP